MPTAVKSIPAVLKPRPTPLVRLQRVAPEGVEVLVKAEFLHRFGSLKDRVAVALLAEALKAGRLKEGRPVVEPTFGNLGVSLAGHAAALGVPCVLVMPDTSPVQRRVLLRHLGAEIVLTPGVEGMPGAVAKAREQVVLRQGVELKPFESQAGVAAHACGTAVEIWEETGGAVDAFVCGVGTGGTITGVARYLKERRPQVRIVAVEPAASAVLSGGVAGEHVIAGIGAGFVPPLYDRSVVDEVIAVPDAAAVETARAVAALEGLPVGVSTGANVWAVRELAARRGWAGKRVVTIACSGAERDLHGALGDEARAAVTV